MKVVVFKLYLKSCINCFLNGFPHFFGSKLVSVPYAVIGGICADNQNARNILFEKAIELTDTLNADYLELRQEVPVDADLKIDTNYYTFKLELDSNPDNIWRNIRKSMRKSVKKAINTGLQVELEYNNFHEFINFYLKDVKHFGTPDQGREWIKGIINSFPENHSVARVHFQGQTVAMFLVRHYKGTVSEVIGNDLPEFRHMNPNQLLEWKLIENAAINGYKHYNFGRTIKDSGSYFFKLGWGAEPVQLYYQYYLKNAKSIPNTSHINPKRQLFSRLWRHLPIIITDTLGPAIRRRFP